MYSWHGWNNGLHCPLYAAASSGLVQDWPGIMAACDSITDSHDRAKLCEWLKHKQAKHKTITLRGHEYAVLPWAHPSYLA